MKLKKYLKVYHDDEAGLVLFFRNLMVKSLQPKGGLNISIQNDPINKLYFKMINYYSGDPHQIQHFVKVHAFAKLIAEQEGATDELLQVIEAAALVHDIGIKKAINQYGRSSGDLQEKLGPAEAEKMLSALNFNKSLIERVCYLVGHHHTYDNIDGLDYQILVEADFLVNIHESEYTKDATRQVNDKIFKTKTGKKVLAKMFFEKIKKEIGNF